MVAQVKTKNEPQEIVTFFGVLVLFFFKQHDNFSLLREVSSGKVLLNIY